MSRYLRNFATFKRHLSRGYFPTRQNGNVRVQRVRILQPLFRNRFLPRAIFWAVVINVAWISLDRRRKGDEEEKEDSVSMKEAVDQVRAVRQTEQVGPGGDVSVGAEEEVQAVPEGEDEDEDEWEDEDAVPETQPDDAWFIPLWFAQQLPPVYYTPEDEEWQEYVKFHDNGALVAQTKMRLLRAIHQTLANSRDFQRSLGAPILIGKQWIELEYPAGPPLEYERLGIEVTDDYVALLYRPVEQRNYSRLQNALWPSVAAESFFTSTTTLFRMEARRLQKLFGGAKDVGDGERSPKDATVDKNAASSPGQGQLPHGPAKSSDQLRQGSTLLLPSLPSPHDDLRLSVRLLRATFARKNTVKVPVPRGTIYITGMVELVGKHSLCVLGLQAIYDPKENKFQTITITPQRPTRRKLTPKGGTPPSR